MSARSLSLWRNWFYIIVQQTHIMTAACGEVFTMTVTEQVDMWTLGAAMHGVLQLGTDTDQQLQACVQQHDSAKCLVAKLSS